MKNQKKHTKLWIILFGCLVVVAALVVVGLVRMEGEKPSITLDLKSPFVGSLREITISAGDARSGLRRIWIALLKGGKEVVLHEEDFPAAGLWGGGKIHESSAKIKIEPAKLGFSDGEAVLRMVVWDYSWRDWWHGNKTYLERKIIIDTRPPEIAVVSRAHNINQGGAGLVIFKTSEACPRSGVMVGGNFFPAHLFQAADKNVYLAFFALGYQQGPQTEIFVTASDRAGNSAKAGFNYHIRRKKFKKDRINITDSFLNRKLPEFSTVLSGKENLTAVEKFLIINRDLRQANYQQLTAFGRKTAGKMLWKGPFSRLPKSASRARFADHRTYVYKGRQIDKQVHLGIDLASVAHSPVPAANSGVVLFAGRVGIYGNTVVLDHGCGLLSMYSHLSRIGVKAGARVSRGDILGHTGTTGLAGGDHLHYGILIHNTFVNPMEWWDRHWIKDNVLYKIKMLKSGMKQE